VSLDEVGGPVFYNLIAARENLAGAFIAATARISKKYKIKNCFSIKKLG
jgi:hypothetical protein